MLPSEATRSVLHIDLDALVANYRLLVSRLSGARCGAVVKADAYGLGAEKIAVALAGAGCEDFFVASVDEGIELRQYLPARRIFVLDGVGSDDAAEAAAHGLIPVLNHRGQIEAWMRATAAKPSPSAIHVDTGMTRLGLSAADIEPMIASGAFERVGPQLLISHLACSEDAAHSMNQTQRLAFVRVLDRLAPVQASLANSSGIFLGGDFHFDLVRPGAALYGINPTPNAPNPMRQVIQLKGKIVQVRDIDSPRTVGYGATHRLNGTARIATISVGYADGYFRALSNQGSGHIGNVRVPVVGRISMDLTTLDVTAAPLAACQPGEFVDLIGPHNPVDDVAAKAGTIAYELLTRLGPRLARVYEGG